MNSCDQGAELAGVTVSAPKPVVACQRRGTMLSIACIGWWPRNVKDGANYSSMAVQPPPPVVRIVKL